MREELDFKSLRFFSENKLRDALFGRRQSIPQQTSLF